jgi:DNA replication protein DnaC
MSVASDLKNNLVQLRLSAIKNCYEDLSIQAMAESFSYEKYLQLLTEKEVENRQENRINRYLKESLLPYSKTLEQLDRSVLPQKVNQQISQILEGHFARHCENILAFGTPGGGKTHLLCAIGHHLIREHQLRVLFLTCSALVERLLAAKNELNLSLALKKLEKFDVIIIDDIGYVEQSRDEMSVLFTFLAERYEKGSLMISSNLPFSKWENIFKDPMTTAAAIDRLVHHSTIIDLNISSYRMGNAKQKMKGENDTINK